MLRSCAHPPQLKLVCYLAMDDAAHRILLNLRYTKASNRCGPMSVPLGVLTWSSVAPPHQPEPSLLRTYAPFHRRNSRRQLQRFVIRSSFSHIAYIGLDIEVTAAPCGRHFANREQMPLHMRYSARSRRAAPLRRELWCIEKMPAHMRHQFAQPFLINALIIPKSSSYSAKPVGLRLANCPICFSRRRWRTCNIRPRSPLMLTLKRPALIRTYNIEFSCPAASIKDRRIPAGIFCLRRPLRGQLQRFVMALPCQSAYLLGNFFDQINIFKKIICSRRRSAR